MLEKEMETMEKKEKILDIDANLLIIFTNKITTGVKVLSEKEMVFFS